MDERHRVDTADLGDIARRILDGTFELRPGCFLEVSTFSWNNNDDHDRQTFIDACKRKSVPYEVVPQIGGIDWVCPKKPDATPL